MIDYGNEEGGGVVLLKGLEIKAAGIFIRGWEIAVESENINLTCGPQGPNLRWQNKKHGPQRGNVVS